jgi:phage tail sheath protein FI
MATAFSYPGVYIKEAAGIGSIVGVSTSDTVFIDFFAQGPVGVATRITSMDGFNRTFGGLDERSEASYAIQQFFLNGGSVAWVVRVVATASITGATPAGAATFTITLGTPPAALSTSNPPTQPTPAATPQTLTATALTVGAWGSSLQIGFDANVLGQTTAPLTVFNMVVRQIATVNGRPTLVAREVYRNLVTDPSSSQYVVTVVNNASSLISLQAGTGTAAPVAKLLPLPLNTDVLTTTTGATAPSTVSFVAVTQKGADGDVPGTAAWTSASGGSGATVLQSGLPALDRMAPYTFSLMCIPAAAELATTKQIAAVYSQALLSCQTYMAFLLVDIPRGSGGTVKYTDANSFMTNWYTDTSIQGLFSDHAAVYYPRLQVPDPLNSYNGRSVAASGTVAGIYARTDANRGVWKAPAGTEANLSNATVDVDPATSIPLNLTDQDNGALNPFGVNAIRNFPVFGTVVWGARTLNGADVMASQWKYVPVRRMALYIEQSLYQGSKWIVFEPNDEPLWSEIRKTFGAFMQALFLQGAFQGKSPSDAYFVRCDSSTTTQNDIDNGVVNILVGFAPLEPAEFVVITIQQIAGQAGT